MASLKGNETPLHLPINVYIAYADFEPGLDDKAIESKLTELLMQPQ